MKKINTPKIGFVSLGCAKALVDSERIITQLRAEGYEIVPTYQEADLVIINTCGFINEAIQESLDTIEEALIENGKVIVTGCLGARKVTILENYPTVLAITGPHAYQEVMEAVHKNLPAPHDPVADLIPKQGIKLTPPHYAYLKISEGCSHHCSYCIIPELRGPLVSRPIGEILHEAENLVEAGVKELLVISQDTGAYGSDINFKNDFYLGKTLKTDLFNLAEQLSQFNSWIRLHYLYPYKSIDNILPLMAENKILPYLDIPFQHSNKRILNLMQRPASGEDNLKRIETWRKMCPDMTIRSTFIVGFPGETDQEFEELLTFLKEAQLDRVGCFKYSHVKGAKANDLPNYIPETIKEERLAQFMQVQAEISANKLAKKIGKTIEVMIDEVNEDHLVGRSKADAPEVDGNVFIEGKYNRIPGDIISVTVDQADEYDLFGRVAE